MLIVLSSKRKENGVFGYDYTKKGNMANQWFEVGYSFTNGFILGKDHLDALVKIIKDTYPDEKPVYRITRIDSYMYTFTDVNDMENEENDGPSLINKLEIIIDSSENIRFNLCFEKNKNSTLWIAGTDEGKTKALFNSIKNTVETKITTVKPILKKESISKLTSVFAIPMLGVMILMFQIFNEEKKYTDIARNILSSTDLEAKMNFLIEQRIHSSMFFSGKGAILMVLMLISMLGVLFSTMISTFMGKRGLFQSTDYFLFGKQIDKYTENQNTKKQIFWGVIVALIVGIIAGLVVNNIG